MTNKPYPTRDLSLAATLLTLKFKMTGITFQYEGARSQPVGYFEFQDTEILQKAVQSYWRGELAIEPRQFTSNVRSLKAQVSNVYKNPHGAGRENAPE